MSLRRMMVSDKMWAHIEPSLQALIGQHSRRKTDNRLFLEGILWIARTGAPWRDLPSEFGNWNSVFKRFRRWTKIGLWSRIRQMLYANAIEHNFIFMDSTVVRAHQHAAGAKGGKNTKLWVDLEADSRPKFTFA